MFAFPPENICKKVKVVDDCQFLFIEALYSTAVNGPAPHEYELGSLKNEIQVNAIRWPFLNNQINVSQ